MAGGFCYLFESGKLFAPYSSFSLTFMIYLCLPLKRTNCWQELRTRLGEVSLFSFIIWQESEIKKPGLDLHTVEVVMAGSSWPHWNIYVCYCLKLDWMNVNIWVQDCCLLGCRTQKSTSISELGSYSEPCKEAGVITVGEQKATPPPTTYTLMLHYQFTPPGGGTRHQ